MRDKGINKNRRSEMRKILIVLAMLFCFTGSVLAKWESSNSDAQSTVLYGNSGTGTITPFKVDVDGKLYTTGISGISGVTAGYIPKAASSTSLTDSTIYQNGTNVGIGSTSPRGSLDVDGGTIYGTNLVLDRALYTAGTPSISSENTLYVTVSNLSVSSHVTDASLSIFNPKDYGAKINALWGTDGSMGIGSASFTSPLTTFSNADVGKILSLRVAGGSSVDLTGTILSISGANTVVLDTTATATVSGVGFIYGTDDTVAIQSAIDAASTNGGGIIYIEGLAIVNGIYSATGAKSQLTLPTVDSTATSKNIIFRGKYFQDMTGGISNSMSGIYSTRYATDGSYSVLSGFDSNNTRNMTNVFVKIENLTFLTGSNPSQSVLNFGTVHKAGADGLQISSNSISDLAHTYLPTHNNSYALITPVVQNDDDIIFNRLRILNFYTGIKAQEHAMFDNLIIFACYNAFSVEGGGYPVQIKYASMERNKRTLAFGQSTANNLLADYLAIENENTGWWTADYTIYDTGSFGRGFVNYILTNVGGSAIQHPVMSGGTQLSLRRISQNRNTIRSNSTPQIFEIDNNSSNSAFTALQLNAAKTTSVGSGFGPLLNFTTEDYDGSIYNGGGISVVVNNTTGATADMLFYTANANSYTEKMRLKNSGNLGISTTVPNALVDINSNSGTVTPLRLSNNLSQASNWNIFATDYNYSSGGNRLVILADSVVSSGALFTLKSDGNIGISTVSPNARLEVSGAVTVDKFMISSTPDSHGNYMIVNASGNVGINSVTPTSKLAIDGSVYFANTTVLTTLVTGSQVICKDYSTGRLGHVTGGTITAPTCTVP